MLLTVPILLYIPTTHVVFMCARKNNILDDSITISQTKFVKNIFPF